MLVGSFNGRGPNVSAKFRRDPRCPLLVTLGRGKILAEAGHDEQIIYVDIGIIHYPSRLIHDFDELPRPAGFLRCQSRHPCNETETV